MSGYEKGWERYQKVRVMNPTMFEALYTESLATGIEFDELVDKVKISEEISKPLDIMKVWGVE